MTTDEIRKAIRGAPFRPFTLRLVSGQQLHIDHPEFVALSKGGRTLAAFSTDENAFEIVDLLMVESIVFGANGHGRRRKSA